ncbi:hypothetical protein BD311DRAFT_811377 [Dichomitus squalens]|uniref:Uncharacterized protein n=1 Tax=Dichomitus squalens TaxID=114155 RepID=A0A4Q9M899_9APHY|nr:hypothetical protein BD311DRAFT_811377 [Dichomitus squalens]
MSNMQTKLHKSHGVGKMGLTSSGPSSSQPHNMLIKEAHTTGPLLTGTSKRQKSKAHAPKSMSTIDAQGKRKRAGSNSVGANAVTVEAKSKKGKHTAANEGSIPTTTNQTSQGKETRATRGRQNKRDTDTAEHVASRPLAASDELSESEIFLAQALVPQCDNACTAKLAAIESSKAVAQISPRTATSSQTHVPVQPKETVEGEILDSSLSSPKKGDIPLYSSEEDDFGSGDDLEDDVDDDEFVATFDAERASWNEEIPLTTNLKGKVKSLAQGSGSSKARQTYQVPLDLLDRNLGSEFDNEEEEAQTSTLTDRQLIETPIWVESPAVSPGTLGTGGVRAMGTPTVAALAAPHVNSTPNTPSFRVAAIPAPSLLRQGPVATPESPSTAVAVQGSAHALPVPAAPQDARQTPLAQNIPAHLPPNANLLPSEFYTLATAVPGGTVLLNPQHLYIRNIVKTSFLRLNVFLVVENTFPDQLAAAWFIGIALVEASQAHGYLGLMQRLRNDEDLLSRLFKKEADSNAAAQYTLVASPTTPDHITTSMKCHLPVSEDGRSWPSRGLGFDPGPSTFQYELSVLKHVDKREVHMVMLTLMGTAIHAALCHITLLTEIKSQNAHGYHTMMHRLFTLASNAVAPIVGPTPQNMLAHVDFAAMEID